MSRRHSHQHNHDDIEDFHQHNNNHRMYYDSQPPYSYSPSYSPSKKALHHRVHSSDNVNYINGGAASSELLETPHGSHDHSVHNHHHNTSPAHHTHQNHRIVPTVVTSTAHLHPQPPVPVYGGGHGHCGHAMPLPGRTTRRKRFVNHKKYRRNNMCYQILFWCQRLYAHWFSSTTLSSSLNTNNNGSLMVAVVLWYSLGVISIGTSKILLGHHELGSIVGNVPPIFLTLQQLYIGSSLLQVVIENPSLLIWEGSSSSSRNMDYPRGVIQPWPKRPPRSASVDSQQREHLRQSVQTTEASEEKAARAKLTSSSEAASLWCKFRELHPSLLWAAVFFGLGFLLTNLGFSGSPASFVETIKASEPITSATIAVGYGIEVLSKQEVISLLAIVAGVILSTLGNHQTTTNTATGATVTSTTAPSPAATASSSSLYACTIIMLSNLCFSFRGLHQKLFRATPQGSMERVDDLNLQFRMQQLGVMMLIGPAILLEGRTLLTSVMWHLMRPRYPPPPNYYYNLPHDPRSPQEAAAAAGAGAVPMYSSSSLSGTIVCYIALSLINGFAFAGYNLSSTYLLSRITVVHHAALNCLRRIFAIVVTSLLFRVPITGTGAMGIACSFIGFMAFSHYKVRRQQAAAKVKQNQESSTSQEDQHPLLLPTHIGGGGEGGEHES